jgi:hypothetical protein
MLKLESGIHALTFKHIIRSEGVYVLKKAELRLEIYDLTGKLAHYQKQQNGNKNGIKIYDK